MKRFISEFFLLPLALFTALLSPKFICMVRLYWFYANAMHIAQSLLAIGSLQAALTYQKPEALFHVRGGEGGIVLEIVHKVSSNDYAHC